ncbi:MAG: putative heme degradation protein [Flavobacterium sp.]|jgi:putative heme degradation protein
MKKRMITAACILLLSACGNDKDASTEAEAIAAPAATETKKAYNPLESQQQLLKDVEEIQAVFDKDSEEKKKALEEINEAPI